ncbi:MAG: ABC transporter permease [Candidatus Tectomicrobia bacterium]|nr:ABC transporter permease [Candidatus Tectomicrobia bacterium]
MADGSVQQIGREEVAVYPSPTPDHPNRRWQEVVRFWRRFKRSKGALFGLLIVCLTIFMAIFPSLFATHDPYEQHPEDFLGPPSAQHWLGADSVGRDIWSRVVYGSRIALIVGILAVMIAMIIGVTLGLIAGYYGGILDTIIMRFIDGLLAFPLLILTIALVAVLGPSVNNVIIAVAVGYIAPFARVTRGDVLGVREETYVEAARLQGVSHLEIMFRHILPNILAPIIVQAALRVSQAIIAESGLSFLGLGPPPPIPTWGSMISEGRRFITIAWWVSTFPGLALVITIVGLNLLGDGLRDVLDPRLKD